VPIAAETELLTKHKTSQVTVSPSGPATHLNWLTICETTE